MSGQPSPAGLTHAATTAPAPRATQAVIELEIATQAGPGWLGSGAAPLTVSLPAETVRFAGSDLQFLAGDTIVRTVPRSEVTALTWRASPSRYRPPGVPRNSGALWTEAERERLRAGVLGDLSWTEIGVQHERTVSAVRREAVRLRLVDELGRRLDQPSSPDRVTVPFQASPQAPLHTPLRDQLATSPQPPLLVPTPTSAPSPSPMQIPSAREHRNANG